VRVGYQWPTSKITAPKATAVRGKKDYSGQVSRTAVEVLLIEPEPPEQFKNTINDEQSDGGVAVDNAGGVADGPIPVSAPHIEKHRA
jgi:hypothetical protein